MGMKIATRTQATTTIARPLKVLVPLIQEELQAGNAAGLEHYRRAGEMLLEAKEQVRHGEWGRWVDKNFHLSMTTAQRYMQLVDVTEKRRARPESTLSSITQPNREAHHRPTWHEPVRQITNRVNVEALASEERARKQEQQLIRQLGNQLIDIGYKVLATKLHPDKGGSAEAMGRLNSVRELLRRTLPQ